MLGSLDADVLHLREVHRFANAPIRLGPTLRWDMDGIYAGIDSGLSGLGAGPLTSVGVDTWGCDYGLVDEHGGLLEPPYHYRDHRTDGVMARVVERIGLDRLYRSTGIQCLPFNTLYQLVAARESSSAPLSAAHRVLTIPDLINHRLTGHMVCEFTNATTTQCVDALTGTWARGLLSDLDLPQSLFGEIVRPGRVLGPLVRARTNSRDAVVVAPACHDTGSAFAAVESGADTAFLSCGTWSLLGTEMPTPVISNQSRALNFTNEGGVEGTFRLLKNIGGLWLLQACRRAWAQAGESPAYEDLVEAARDDRHAFRAVIDPDHATFLNPDDMPAAIRDYCDRTGQPSPQGPGGYTRTILESLALKYRVVLDALEEISGRRFRTIRIVGGGSRNRLLAQFTADATGRLVLAGPVEATALGNIAVQMVSTGAVRSLAEAREIVGRSFPPDQFEPQPAAGWDAALERLRRLS